MRQQDTGTQQDEYVTMRQLCRRLNISRSTVYRHGLLCYAIPIGRGWRFNWREVLGHYAEQRETSSGGQG